jgi:bifunctional DNase/RNase
MKTLVRALHGTLSQVVIGALKNNTYYAQVFVQNGDEDVVAIDARPSDSIALALRLNAPIFASEELLDHTAEDVGQSGEEGSTTEYDAEDLKEYLRRMNPEDFGRFTM